MMMEMRVMLNARTMERIRSRLPTLKSLASVHGVTLEIDGAEVVLRGENRERLESAMEEWKAVDRAERTGAEEKSAPDAPAGASTASGSSAEERRVERAKCALEAIERKMGQGLREPETIALLARLRGEGALDGKDWRRVRSWFRQAVRWLDKINWEEEERLADEADAIEFAARREEAAKKGILLVDLNDPYYTGGGHWLTGQNTKKKSLGRDADPRKTKGLHAVRAHKLTGRILPSWATLWLWRLGSDRDDHFWGGVRECAERMGLPEIKADATDE